MYQNLYMKFVNKFNYFNHLNKFHYNYLVSYFYIHIFIKIKKKNHVFQSILLVRFHHQYLDILNLFSSARHIGLYSMN